MQRRSIRTRKRGVCPALRRGLYKAFAFLLGSVMMYIGGKCLPRFEAGLAVL
jgi:demethoxyubiquinone hydroxylase (CLK1/Coq7/Cat5 family)